MSVNWYGDEIKRRIEAKTPAFLRGVGEALINQMITSAHVDTGLLINSMNYKVFDGTQSMFGKEVGIRKTDKYPTEEDRVSTPEKGYVRAGSALVYAGPQERHNNWCTKSLDHFRREKNWLSVLKKVYGKI